MAISDQNRPIRCLFTLWDCQIGPKGPKRVQNWSFWTLLVQIEGVSRCLLSPWPCSQILKEMHVGDPPYMHFLKEMHVEVSLWSFP